MGVDGALQRLQAAAIRLIAVSALQTDPAFQPREGRMVPFRDKGRVEQRSEEHVGALRLALDASCSIELEPILVADVDGGLYVVDGHHRLKAYRRALRETVPARVMSMTKQDAVLVSKVVNCTARALEMHPEQRRDAAWQYLAAVTHRGAKTLPKGESLRSVAARFGISPDTAHRMLRKLPKVELRDWNDAALDAGTGFPRWRYVREGGAGWQDMKQELGVEQLTQHNAEKLAKKLAALMEKATSEEVQRALRILRIEDQLETVNEDARDFDSATTVGMDF